MTAEYEYIWRGRQKKYRTQCDYKKRGGSFAFQIPARESIDNMIQPFMGVCHTKKFA